MDKNIYRTKEIRWFFREENKSILRWFNKLDFDTLEEREDVYLNLKKEDVGIKLREGHIEIKHCVGTRSKGCLSRQTWGYFEKYLKWSFSTNENNPLYEEVAKGSHGEWVSVKKRRNVLQLIEESGEIVLRCPSVQTNKSCQLEYTKLTVNGKKWYTFALEWSGNDPIWIEPDFISEIIGNTALNCRQSMGYAEFLSKNAMSTKSPVLVSKKPVNNELVIICNKR